MDDFSTDKALIQQRMYKEAAEVYKQYLKQDISSLDGFDPLVLMLINACASEFKIFADEIESSKTRMLTHLAGVLIPDAYIGPKPAHAVLHAPIKDSQIITDKFKDKFSYTFSEEEKFMFMPTGEFQLLNGTVAYMASGNSFFALKNYTDKDELFRTEHNSLAAGTLWIGLEIDAESLDTDYLSFYFDLPFESNPNRLDELLFSSRWQTEDMELNGSRGLRLAESDGNSEKFAEFHLIRQHESEINAYYNHKFVTVTLPENKQFSDLKLQLYPKELVDCFGVENLEGELKKDILWIKTDFSRASFSSEKTLTDTLYKLIGQINCFPVVNRRFHKPHPFSLNEAFNMFVLNVKGEDFYGIEDVKSSDTKKYYIEKPFSQFVKGDNKNKESKIYALRKQGVHRFDKRASMEYMENVLQIIREETSIYNALGGSNIIIRNLKDIQKSVNDIRGKMNETRRESVMEHKIFIAFPPAEKEYVVVRFWSTKGAAAKNIPLGEPLTTVDSSRGGYDDKGLKLMTTSVGGEDGALKKDHLSLFRSALTVKDKIVTEEDIRFYCYQVAGENIRDWRIEKGAKIGQGKREGFIRTLNVFITLKNDSNPQYMTYLTEKLTVELNEKSASYLPIEVFVN